MKAFLNDLLCCPVCEGTKRSPIGGNYECRCCNGKGEITRKHKEALDRIKADLKKRLAEARAT